MQKLPEKNPMYYVEPDSESEALQTNIVEPWARLNRETDQQWIVFQAYRDSAYPDGPGNDFKPRNLSNIARALGISYAQVYNWSTSLNWAQRAAAYDRALDRARIQADQTEVERVRSRHLRLLGKARTLAEVELDKWITKAENSDTNIMKIGEVREFLDFIIRQERLICGESTDRIEMTGKGGWDLESLSLEELEKLEELRAKAKG